MYKILITVLLIIFSQSCTSEEIEVKKITNESKVNIEELKLSLKEVLSINSSDSNFEKETELVNPKSYQVDKNGNIFIFDAYSSSIVKFNSNGKYLNAFGRIGAGPGEYKQAHEIKIIHDNIVICDQATRNLVFFDNNGNFTEKIALSKNFPTEIITVGLDKYLALNNYQSQKNGKPYFGFALTLLNKEFKEIKMIWTEECVMGADLGLKITEMSNHIPSYTVSENRIYIAQKETDIYKIDCFSFDGELREIIKKKYRSIYKTKEEIKNSYGASYTEVNGETGKMEVFKGDVEKYKYSINGILVDKKNRLWVETVKDAKKFDIDKYKFYDIFDENGLLLKTLKVDKNLKNIQFVNDKMYTFKIVEEEKILTVYKYEIK